MDETRTPQFSELVEKQLGSDGNSRDLWRPIADVFNREGPDAAKIHLEAERRQFLEHIERLLGQVEEG